MLQKNVNIRQHRTIGERLEAARMLREDVDLGKARLLVDTIENKTNMAYAALPERLFILHDGKISLIGGVGPMFYRVSVVERWLETFSEERMITLTI